MDIHPMRYNAKHVPPEAIMDGLQIVHTHRLQVLLGGGHAGVTEHLGEVKQISTIPQVRDREVPRCSPRLLGDHRGVCLRV